MMSYRGHYVVKFVGSLQKFFLESLIIETYQYFEKGEHHFFKHFNMNTERVTKYGCRGDPSRP